MTELKHKNITEKIIGASFEVHKFLGNGFQAFLQKGHSGKLKVKSSEGDGCEFTIGLPTSSTPVVPN